MNLIQRNNLLDNWLDRDYPSFRLLPETDTKHSMLAVDINETSTGFQLKADFPGLKKEEIKVTLENNMLTLSAEHNEEKEQKEKGKIIRQERRYGSYSRSFNLGTDIDETKINAHFSDGVLTLDIPRSMTNHLQSKVITVK